MIDPRSVSPGSNMPTYAQLATDKVDFERTEPKLRAMRSIGVPYTPEQVQGAARDAAAQGEVIAADLKANGATVAADSELVALISYLQRLGKAELPASAPPGAPVSSLPSPVTP
jgi:cytochrome c oxidase cbb3-type subunit I/II